MAVNNAFLCVICAIALSGCGTNMPVQKTGNPNEYVINRDDKSPFGSLPSVKKAVLFDAANFCAAMNKKPIEKHSIDKERAVLVWPETTLYFECAEPGVAPLPNSAQTSLAKESQRTSALYSELVKLNELLKNGIISDAEFESEKKKLLNAN